MVNRINDFWKPFYYRWVETFLEKRGGSDLVPLKHFLHRFTRSVFWELEDMIPL
jgi:delta24-sterol reductase